MAVAASGPIRWEHDAPPNEPRCDLVDEHFPLLFISFAGELQPQQVLELIRFVDGVHERATAEQVGLLTICDARGSSRPSDVVRKMLVDWLRQEFTSSSPALGSIIVASDPLVRGAIAAIKWATGRHDDELAVVRTPEEALARARQRFAKAGLTPPAVLDD